MTVELATSPESFLYDQVSRHISGLIDKGTLKPGDRAPSLRKLSQQLKVSISTVSQAYASLESQGVLRAKPQSGFFVSPDLGRSLELPKRTSVGSQPKKVRFGELFEEIFITANDPGVAPLGAAKPSMALMPAKGLNRATSRMASRYPEACLDYCFPPGHGDLRRQIALRHAEIGVSVSPEEVIITSGATEGLFLSLQSVAHRGDVIAVESPTYFSVLRLIERMGMLALEIESDPETGMSIDSLESVLETMDIKAVLSVPNFNNPFGSLMPDDNKKRLVDLLAQHGVPLIEDDVYGDLYFGGERPGLAKQYDVNGEVISCSSFSKTLAPGYRIGWVLAGRYHDSLLEWKQATSSATSSLNQLGVAEFLRNGDYDRHLVRLRKAYREQVERMRFMIVQHFPEGTRVSDPKGGFVLWVELPRGSDCLEIFNEALAQKIGITPGILFSATRKFKNYIRLNCGFPWTEELEAAVSTLGQIIKRQLGA